LNAVRDKPPNLILRAKLHGGEGWRVGDQEHLALPHLHAFQQQILPYSRYDYLVV